MVYSPIATVLDVNVLVANRRLHSPQNFHDTLFHGFPEGQSRRVIAGAIN
jgi:hypothetical protein